MSVKERFVNPEGRCCVKYFRDGSKILTAGPDGDVNVFSGIDDNAGEPFLAGDEVLGLCVNDQERIFVAPKIEPGFEGCNEVLAFAIKDGKGEPDGTITKFSAEATCLDVIDKQVLAGSADMTLTLIHTETFKKVTFAGHEAPILAVALHPKLEYALSSSCDGSVKLWNITDQSCIETWSNLWKKSNDICNSETIGIIAWHPIKDTFALPTKNKVQILNKDHSGTWSEMMSVQASNKEDEFTSVTFSSDGSNLVGGTKNGKMVFWSYPGGRLVNECKSAKSSPICGLDWNPKVQDEIAFIKEDGHWGTVTDFLSEKKEASESVIDEKNMNPDELAAALFDDDSNDNENSFSIRQIKKDTGFLDEESTNQSAPNADFAQDDLDLDQESKKETEEFVAPQVPVQAVPSIEYDPQEPFQPGSTPTHLESRFMVWNSVGIVRSFNSEDESSVDVEFHDTSVHHPIHLGNSNGYTMADLSVEAVLLATEADEADGTAVPSKLTCHNFAGSGLSKEWSIDMPDKEDIMAICCGIGWVAAATDRRNLRIFTLGGMQREVLTLPGPIVALSGHKTKIMITVHSGMPIPGNQSISFAVFDIGTDHDHQVPNFQPLALAPKAFLSWQGFTDEGTPCLMDSAGYIRIWNNSYGSSWIQVCDSKSEAKGKSDHFFMVGANVQEFQARCILVKGSRFPATVPKPVITILNFTLPLCGVENEKFKNEQVYWKSRLIGKSIEDLDEHSLVVSNDEISRIENEALIKLFAHACQLEQETRAMDVCKLMTSDGLQLAIKYATKIKRMQLATKISAMAYAKQEAEEQEQKVAKEYSPSQASEDIFATQDDDDIDMLDTPENPFLAAQARHESSSKSFITPTSGSSRNPFAKNSPAIGSSGGSSRSGLIFDDISKKDVMKSGSRAKVAFGAKKLENITPNSRTLTLTKRVDKENKMKNTNIETSTTNAGKDLKKGFQLWYDENSQKVSEEENIMDEQVLTDHCLDIWKTMSKADKESYKTPRVPKRPREHDDKTSTTSSKLAKFSANPL